MVWSTQKLGLSFLCMFTFLSTVHSKNDHLSKLFFEFKRSQGCNSRRFLNQEHFKINCWNKKFPSYYSDLETIQLKKKSLKMQWSLLGKSRVWQRNSRKKPSIILYLYPGKLLNCYNHKDHFGLITDVQRSGQCPTDV